MIEIGDVKKKKNNGRTTWIVQRNEKKTIVFDKRTVVSNKILKDRLLLNERQTFKRTIGFYWTKDFSELSD